ncbi:MAG: hypothetical protein A3B47_00550 [Candidatus Levybacteria bacterium RIFCSPLOWO2_01_FULL_39_24]|nr:MAG: hypothetical protein A2800_00640 [Candidatus Levybacteria bacterium RIFCSPHIGHO2_01_FULL_40_16]OGH46266.1 MAG: hypothetical protein A3B47_00550 [Candidatus Levybacteria bacterium RIFCSPLOWO2_01_FULL_39_24]
MFKNKNLITYLLLIFVFMLAAFLRFYNLSSFPVGFHQDEASLGYNGYSLMLTGKDDNSNKFPLYIDMFGDNRPSGYHYLTILPIKLFDLNEFATRLPGALFGSITIFAIYLLTYAIFKNKKLSLLSSLFIAISPWHVSVSRASSETIVALFFIILGFSLLIYSLQNERLKYVLLGTISLGLSFFFYHTPRVFAPLLYLALIIYLFSFGREVGKRLKNSFILSFLFLSIFALVLIFAIKGGTGRFSQVNIFGFPETKLIMEEQIKEDGVARTNIPTTRLFHNKIINYSFSFLSNYFDYFTGQFLFMKGGLPIWYRVPGMGLVYLIEFPFIVIGAILLVINKNKLYKIPIIWILIAPVVTSITMDDIPNLQRTIVMLPAIEIIAAFGLYNFINSRRGILKPVVASILTILFIFNFAYFLHQYFIHAKLHRTWYRNNGFKEVIRTVYKDYAGYDSIIITKSEGGIYPLILFYTKYGPALYQKEGSPKDREYAGFGKFFFVPQSCPSVDKDNRFPKGKSIYVDNGTCPDNAALDNKKETVINREDGTRAFRIIYD